MCAYSSSRSRGRVWATLCAWLPSVDLRPIVSILIFTLDHRYGYSQYPLRGGSQAAGRDTLVDQNYSHSMVLGGFELMS
jgi:hypothetical protein